MVISFLSWGVSDSTIIRRTGSVPEGRTTIRASFLWVAWSLAASGAICFASWVWSPATGTFVRVWGTGRNSSARSSREVSVRSMISKISNAASRPSLAWECWAAIMWPEGSPPRLQLLAVSSRWMWRSPTGTSLNSRPQLVRAWRRPRLVMGVITTVLPDSSPRAACRGRGWPAGCRLPRFFRWGRP